jgi:4-amino-4-deoxy-L-arabinose transferase-like glycosyltransferase
MPNEKRNARKRLYCLLAGGAIVRLVIWACFVSTPMFPDDEADYNGLAVRLVERGEYCDEQGKLISLRPPLYPAMIATCYKLFGVENYQSVRALQAGLSLLTAALVYLLGAELYSQRIGLWAAAFTCFYPSFLAYNNLLLTEVFFTLLLTAACLTSLRAIKRESMRDFAVSGILFGLGALTRSVLWLFPLVFATFILACCSMPFRRRALAASALCIAFAATIAPWAVRNTRIQKTPTIIDVMGGRNLMMGNYEHTPLHRSWAAISIDGEKAWYRVLAARHGPLEGLTQGMIDKLAMRSGVGFVLQNPLLTLRRDFVKFLDFWQLEREVLAGASQGRFGPLSRTTFLALAFLIVGGYACLILTAIFGAICAPPQDWRSHAFLLLMIAFVCGMHTLVFGHSRYHLPLIPVISIYSASALVGFRRIWLERASWRPLVAGLVCAAAVGAWVYEIIITNYEALESALHSAA